VRLPAPLLRVGLWAAANSVAGALIGLAIAAFQEGSLDARIIWVSVLFGNVVGFTAIVSAVYVFPRYLVLPAPARFLLQAATLVGVSILGTGIVVLSYPLFFLHEFRTAIRIFAVNGVVATIVGMVLFSYETMRARLAESLRIVEEVRLKEADLRAQAARAQLAALQAQIKPHFFFNTLNTISALVEDDPERAEETIARLADLFRYTLRTTGTSLVPFGDEVGFVEKYLEIERARFGERLGVAIDLGPACADVPVPGLMLQPVVENAVVHGIAPRARGGAIRIEARRRMGILEVDVVDDGPGPGAADRIFSAGHGLANVRERIRTLYGEEGSLSIDRGEAGGTRVRFRLPVTPPWSSQIEKERALARERALP
jgi:sensor histidine kinase YesM